MRSPSDSGCASEREGMTDRMRRTQGLEDGRAPANRITGGRPCDSRSLGRMAGSVVSMETLQVVNLGTSGALVESALPLPPNAEFKMQLVLDGHVSEATVKIRRVGEIRPGERGAALPDRPRVPGSVRGSRRSDSPVRQRQPGADLTAGVLGAMTYSFPERRRSLRAAVDGNSWLAMPSTWPVQLLELSLGGLAFTSPYDIEPGRTASVRATFGGRRSTARSGSAGAGRARRSRSNRPGFEIGACSCRSTTAVGGRWSRS